MSEAQRTSDALHARVQQAIAAWQHGSESEPFDRLACDIARFQAAHVPAVARLVAARWLDPARFEHAEQIPAVPCDAFRLRRIAAHAPADDACVFRTSGTTADARGEHPLRVTATYRLAALAFAARMLWPDGTAFGSIILAPSEQSAPDSSLSFMLARFAETLTRGSSWHVHGGELDATSVTDACRQAREAGVPTLVTATSFALVHLCDRASASLALPEGSRVMSTGGFKGRAREVDPATLRRTVAARFAIPETHVVGEYGMTELSSQLYQATLAHALGALAAPTSATAYYAPPWLRAQAVDPESLAPLPAGEEGICRLVDLANVDSAVAVQTADRVVALADGGIELLGRAAGAPPRGCSLTVEHLLG